MTNDTQAPASGDIFGQARWLRIAGNILTAVYLVSAAALLAWGAWKRFQLPHEPMIDPDIEGYLGPAITALAGKPFPHMIGRAFPYPALVYLILRVFGDFRAISVIQHLLGIAAGGLVMLAWNAACDLTPAGGIPKVLSRFIGLAPAYVCLGAATAISFEQQIRPEAMFPFLAILNSLVSFRFLEARFVRKRPLFIWLGAINAFLAFLIYMFKPSFGFATILCTLPVWISLLLPGASLRQKAALGAAAILPAALLLFLPEHILKKNDPWSRVFLPETLLCAHPVVILQQMSEDLAGTGPLPYPRSIVQAAHDMLASELATAAVVTASQAEGSSGYKSVYPVLEYLQYDDSFCDKFPAVAHFDTPAMADFCMTYYLRALRHHPGPIMAQAVGQLAHFYTAKCPVYWLGKAMNLSALQYARVAPLMVPTTQLDPGNPAMLRYIAACKQLAGRDIAIPQARRFVEWLRMLSAHYLDLLGVALASPILLLFRPLRAHFLWLIAALWLTFSYNFGDSLTCALVHSLELTRYIRIQLIFTVFAQFLSLYLLLELAAFGIRAGIARLLPERARERTA